MTPCKFLDDKRRCGCSSSEVIHWKSTKPEIFLENWGITVEELASELDVSVSTTFGIIKSLQYNKVCIKRVPGTKEVELVTQECTSFT